MPFTDDSDGTNKSTDNTFGAQGVHYKQDFYTGAQVRLYFNDVWIDDAIMINYQYTETKGPLFGYASRYFDAMMPGSRIVTGNFAIAFKENGYIIKAIQMSLIKDKDENKEIEIDGTKYRTDVGAWPELFTADDLTSEFKTIDMDKEILGIHPDSGKSFPVRADELDLVNAYDLIFIHPRVSRGFNIVIKFFNEAGEIASTTTIYNVHLTTNGKSVNVESGDGSVVIEMYQFFAQSINTEISNIPRPRKWAADLEAILGGNVFALGGIGPDAVPGYSEWERGVPYSIGKCGYFIDITDDDGNVIDRKWIAKCADGADWEFKDADTIYVKNPPASIRFAGINAPEKQKIEDDASSEVKKRALNDQNRESSIYANEETARKMVRAFMYGQDQSITLIYECEDNPRYNRSVCWIKLNAPVDINEPKYDEKDSGKLESELNDTNVAFASTYVEYQNEDARPTVSNNLTNIGQEPYLNVYLALLGKASNNYEFRVMYLSNLQWARVDKTNPTTNNEIDNFYWTKTSTFDKLLIIRSLDTDAAKNRSINSLNTTGS